MLRKMRLVVFLDLHHHFNDARKCSSLDEELKASTSCGPENGIIDERLQFGFDDETPRFHRKDKTRDVEKDGTVSSEAPGETEESEIEKLSQGLAEMLQLAAKGLLLLRSEFIINGQKWNIEVAKDKNNIFIDFEDFQPSFRERVSTFKSPKEREKAQENEREKQQKYHQHVDLQYQSGGWECVSYLCPTLFPRVLC